MVWEAGNGTERIGVKLAREPAFVFPLSGSMLQNELKMNCCRGSSCHTLSQLTICAPMRRQQCIPPRFFEVVNTKRLKWPPSRKFLVPHSAPDFIDKENSGSQAMVGAGLSREPSRGNTSSACFPHWAHLGVREFKASSVLNLGFHLLPVHRDPEFNSPARAPHCVFNTADFPGWTFMDTHMGRGVSHQRGGHRISRAESGSKQSNVSGTDTDPPAPMPSWKKASARLCG
ncbi:hypothetical protein DFH07DRAFT_778798 [Mycena maculata]|uniref:Uncharacterized protein n=1 Tax=Mycena maculata TaxID=230809 RepID=A0AAD7MZ14_9AGAR|nr:hypothetical protein DFH07DRAFT_778798 [Mycena maculata]